MPKIKKIAVWSGFVVVVLAIMPLVIGNLLQMNYKPLISILDDKDNITVKVEEYKKGWFTSEATIVINIKNIKSAFKAKKYFLDYQTLPNKFVIKQKIKHGPIFYSSSVGLPYFIGLAAIENKTDNKIINKLIIKDIDYISFRYNVHKYLNVNSLNIIFPGRDIKIKSFNNVISVWYNSSNNIFDSKIKMKGITLTNNYDKLVIPRIDVSIANSKKLWIGENSITIPRVLLFYDEKEIGQAQGLIFEGATKENENFLNGVRKFYIRKLNYNDYHFGPISLKLSFDKLNKLATENLVASYNQIIEEGELYKSQLKYKMLIMLPQIINNGSKISIDYLYIDTPDGGVRNSTEVIWKIPKESIPDDLSELLLLANAHADLSISKNVTYKLMDLLSKSLLLNGSTRSLKSAYKKATNKINFYSMLNETFINSLVAKGDLTKQDALNLLELQKNYASLNYYGTAIKLMLFNNSISKATSHKLVYSYMQVIKPYEDFNKAVSRLQERLYNEYDYKLNKWLDEGYIKVNGDNYSTTITQDDSKLYVNGSVVSVYSI